MTPVFQAYTWHLVKLFHFASHEVKYSKIPLYWTPLRPSKNSSLDGWYTSLEGYFHKLYKGTVLCDLVKWFQYLSHKVK